MRSLIIALTVCCALPAAAEEACKLTSIGFGEVAAVRDGRTLALKDGRELRLAAIEVTEASRAALQAALVDKRLRLEKLAEDRDRYGRVVAFAFAGGATSSLQQMLLEQGAARVSSRVGDLGCARLLQSSERQAREASRGLWADPTFAPLPAENFLRLQAARGNFVLVEGKVLSVRESGATIYMNFGRRWTQALTVTILRREARRFTAAGLEPKRLEGRRLRVRGILEQRTGPTIEAMAPEQIEFTD